MRQWATETTRAGGGFRKQIFAKLIDLVLCRYEAVPFGELEGNAEVVCREGYPCDWGTRLLSIMSLSSGFKMARSYRGSEFWSPLGLIVGKHVGGPSVFYVQLTIHD